jgi:hypothetical protein
MAKNPRTLVVTTPDETETVENVETWWREGPDLIVRLTTGCEKRFPLGEVLD